MKIDGQRNLEISIPMLSNNFSQYLIALWTLWNSSENESVVQWGLENGSIINY